LTKLQILFQQSNVTQDKKLKKAELLFLLRAVNRECERLGRFQDQEQVCVLWQRVGTHLAVCVTLSLCVTLPVSLCLHFLLAVLTDQL